MRLSDEDIEERIVACDNATAGPWGWRGNDNGLVELRGPGHFGPYDRRLISAVRGEPCFTYGDYVGVVENPSACENCIKAWATRDYDGEYPCLKPENLNTIWVTDPDPMVLRPINQWAVRERHYRPDVIDVTHPDAAHVATYDPTTVRAMLLEIRALRSMVGQLIDGMDDLFETTMFSADEESYERYYSASCTLAAAHHFVQEMADHG